MQISNTSDDESQISTHENIEQNDIAPAERTLLNVNRLLAAYEATNQWMGAIATLPITAIAGVFYGLTHDKSSAEDAKSVNYTRKLHEAKKLHDAVDILNKRYNGHGYTPGGDDMAQPAMHDDLRKLLESKDFTQLREVIQREIHASNNDVSAQEFLNKQKAAVDRLESVCKKLGSDKQYTDLTKYVDCIKTMNDIFKADKIDVDDEILKLIFGNNDVNIPLPKDMEKTVFKICQKFGESVKSKFEGIEEIISHNDFIQLIASTLSLAVLMILYSSLYFVKIAKDITLAPFEILKAFLIGITGTRDNNMERLLIDFSKPIAEVKEAYRRNFEAHDAALHEFDYAKGKKAPILVIEKLITEIIAKTSKSYQKLSDPKLEKGQNNVVANTLNQAQEMHTLEVQIKKATKEQNDSLLQLQQEYADKAETLRQTFDQNLQLQQGEIHNPLASFRSIINTTDELIKRTAITAGHKCGSWIHSVINSRANDGNGGIEL